MYLKNEIIKEKLIEKDYEKYIHFKDNYLDFMFVSCFKKITLPKKLIQLMSGKIFKFKEELKDYMEKLNMNSKNMERSLNVGFSGGEKKRCELLQLMLLQPQLALLDELDSGLDVDAKKRVIHILQTMRQRQRWG